MTEEERNEFQGKFTEVWNEFVAKYPTTYGLFPLEEVAYYFFEKGREDAMDRVWDALKK